MHGKHGFAIATYEIADGGQVIKLLKKFFLVSGAARRGQLLVNVDFDQDPASAAVSHRLERKLDRLHSAIRRGQGKSCFERLFTELLLIRIIWKPFFMKRQDRCRGVLASWKEKGI